MKTDLSKIAVVIIADKNGKMMQRFSPNSYMTQGSVMTIRTEYDDQANGVNARTEPALPIQNVSQQSEPLVAFMKWYKNNVHVGTQETSEQIVEKYLATNGG